MSNRRPILLALSTFRRSAEAAERAIALAAREHRKLIIVFVVDVNLARYFIGTGLVAGSRLREDCEAGMLERHKQAALVDGGAVLARAREAGVDYELTVSLGRFAVEVLKAVREVRPERVFTVRSDRPAWLRRIFGSPVDRLVREAGCPVEVVAGAVSGVAAKR